VELGLVAMVLAVVAMVLAVVAAEVAVEEKVHLYR
jgi:hypothetical protein